MKRLFAGIAVLLALASAATVMSLRSRSGRPEIVWTAGLSQDRVEQAALFHEWLRNEGYVDENGELLFTLRLEAADNQSTLIQAVSGVAGDLIDHVPVSRFAPMGVLEDITEFAAENGLDPARNYPGAASLLTSGGRQYAFPCNLAARGLLVNLDTFAEYGVEPPPEEWTPEEFERIGLEFTRRANAGKARQEVFFAGPMPEMILPLARSLGGDVFNETMTASALASPAFEKALSLYCRWSGELKLIPDASDIASESADSSSANGEATPQLMRGRYGMIPTGRYVNMDLRRSPRGTFRYGFVQFPEYGFKNTELTVRCTSIYKGSKHKEFAKIFLKFLAGRDYNELLIRSSDGLPPNPAWAKENPAFHTPPERPFEGKLHTNELKWALTIGIPESRSPFYPLNDNKINYACQKVENKLASVPEALRLAADAIDHSIRAAVEGTPSLREPYRQACELQKKIDARKAAGEKIPAAWISNPFFLSYYRSKGMLAE